MIGRLGRTENVFPRSDPRSISRPPMSTLRKFSGHVLLPNNHFRLVVHRRVLFPV